MDKWAQLKIYIALELEKPWNNDDIPRSIYEDILYKMKSLEEEYN